MSISPVPEPLPTSFVLKRRLIGLLVLLLFLFLFSILLRGLGQPRENQEDGLQTVVVPLGSSELPPVVAPPEPETAVEEPSSEPPAEPAAAPAPQAEPVREPTSAPAPANEPAPKPAAAPLPSKSEKAAPEKPTMKAPAASAPTTKSPAGTARWYVVLGSFSDAANAKALALRARQSGFKAEVLPMKSGGSSLNRVRVGPFKTEAEGQGARATLIVEGMTGAKLVKEP